MTAQIEDAYPEMKAWHLSRLVVRKDLCTIYLMLLHDILELADEINSDMRIDISLVCK